MRGRTPASATLLHRGHYPMADSSTTPTATVYWNRRYRCPAQTGSVPSILRDLCDRERLVQGMAEPRLRHLTCCIGPGEMQE
jgi:hypothetical protein